MLREIQARRPRRLVTGLAAVTVLALTSACGPTPKKPSSGGAGKSSSASGSTVVHVKNFAFDPQKLSVTKGTKVTWMFEDSTPHTATASDKSFDSKSKKAGGSFSFTFAKPGTYAYICTFHQYMTGTITVK